MDAEDERPTYWTQFDIALSRQGEGGAAASARRVFGLLDVPVAAWRAAGVVTHVWFVRKPPDVRLRIGCPELDDAVAEGVRRVLAHARSHGAVLRSATSIYEPEARKFGGAGSMAAVHNWFDADTRRWYELDQHADGPRPPQCTIDAVVGATLDDLFFRCVDDDGEIWDCWQNLGTGILGPATSDRDGPLLTPSPQPTLAEIVDGLNGAGLSRVASAQAAATKDNARLAAALHGQRALGRLTVGMRALVAHIARNSCNRWGIDRDHQAALVISRSWQWDPSRQMRGADRAHHEDSRSP